VTHTDTAELDLVATVVTDAYLTIQAGLASKVRGGRNAGQTHAAAGDAIRWFRSNNDGPFSYLWCCQALNCRPEKIREQVAIIAEKFRWKGL